MKNRFSRNFNRILFSLVTLCSPTWSQTNFSSIVGYQTATINANGGSGTRYSLVAANLLNPESWAGSLDNTLKAAPGSFTAGAFNQGSTYAKFYVEITSGSAAGSQADIVSNTTDTLTVTGQTAFQNAIGSGASVKIRKHRTLADVFGGASGTTGDATVVIGKGANSGVADNILLKEGGVDKTFFYSTSALKPGWRDSALNASADRPIYQNQGIVVARRANSNLSYTLVGEAKSGVSFYDLPQGFNAVTYPIPADATLPQIFGGSSGTTGATDVKIAKGANSGTSDNILVAQPNGTYTTYFYSTSALKPGWRDASLNSASNVVVSGSSALFIKKLANGNMSITTNTNP